MYKGCVPLKVTILESTPNPEELIERVAADSYVTQRLGEQIAPKRIKFKSGRIVPFSEFGLTEDPVLGDPIPGYEKDDQSVLEILPKSATRAVRFIRAIGHHKLFEMCTVTFHLTGITRKAALHLCRYEYKTTNFQSQKYQPQDQFNYVMPSENIATDEDRAELAECMHQIQKMYERLRKRGLDPEWARGVYPNIIAQTMTFHTNLRQFRHMLDCLGDEEYVDEVQIILTEMFKLIRVEAPALFDDFKLTDGGLVVRNSKRYARNVCPNWVLGEDKRKEFDLD